MARGKNPLSFNEETMKNIYRNAGLCFVCGCNLKKCECENEAAKILDECKCEELLENEDYENLPCANCKEEIEVDVRADDIADFRSCEKFNESL